MQESTIESWENAINSAEFTVEKGDEYLKTIQDNGLLNSSNPNCSQYSYIIGLIAMRQRELK